MCRMHYVRHTPCDCIHFYRPPTYCQTFLTSHQQTYIQLYADFEQKVITFHPALDGLMLSRDHIRFLHHKSRVKIEAKVLRECEDAVIVEEAMGETMRDMQEEGCPLCVQNGDVIRTMEDAARGCKLNEAAIKRRIRKGIARADKARRQKDRLVKILERAKEKVRAEEKLRKERSLKGRRERRAERDESQRGLVFKKARGKPAREKQVLFPEVAAAVDACGEAGLDLAKVETSDSKPEDLKIDHMIIRRTKMEDTITGYARSRCVNMGYHVPIVRGNVEADLMKAKKLELKNNGKNVWNWNHTGQGMVPGGDAMNHIDDDSRLFASEEMDLGEAVDPISDDLKWISSPQNETDTEVEYEDIRNLGNGSAEKEGVDGNGFDPWRGAAHSSSGNTVTFADSCSHLHLTSKSCEESPSQYCVAET